MTYFIAQQIFSKGIQLLCIVLLVVLFPISVFSQDSKSIDLSASYIGESFSNLNGGIKRGSNYKGLLDLSAEINLDKLIKIKRTKLKVNMMHVHGKNISDYIGDDLLVSYIEALEGLRVQNMWVEHQLKNEKVLFRIGKQAIDDEFMTTDISNLFLHGIAAYPFTLSSNYPQWPVAALAIFGAFEVSPAITLKTGVYQAGSEVTDEVINSNGLDFSLDPSGYLLIGELGYRKNNDLLLAGIMHDTNKYTNSNNIENKGLTAVYFAIEKQLTNKEKEKGLYAFASGSLATNWEYALFDIDIRGAISYKHALLKKDTELGLGYFYPYRNNKENPDTDLKFQTEQFAELTYSLSLNDYIQMQTSLQYIINPGGANGTSTANATVWAIRMYLNI